MINCHGAKIDLVMYLVNDDVIVFNSLFCTVTEVVGENVHYAMKKFYHKQRGDWKM